jgi:hypothetical protein
LVNTKPQGNEVLDDSSLIKRLQRELAETQKLVEGKEHQQQMQQAAQSALREAEAKLRCLKACFLKAWLLPNTLVGNHSKRRHSDVFCGSMTKAVKALSTGYFSDDLMFDKEKVKVGYNSAEAELLKDALYAKREKNQQLNEVISILLSKLEKAEQELTSTYDQNLTLQKTNKAAEAQAKTFAAAKEFMQAEFDRILYERNEYQKQSESQYELCMEAKDIETENIMEELTKVREEKKATEDELATTKKENEDLHQAEIKEGLQ